MNMKSVFLVIASVMAGARSLSSQTDPRLVAIVRLAEEGFTDSARTAMKTMLAAVQETDSLYPEVLYTSAIVAETARERRAALQRLVVEYSTSDWADDGLLLLAKDEYALGNFASTVKRVQRIVADYRKSPIVAEAALWGARAASDLHEGEQACKLADAGLAAKTKDVELKNQLEFQKLRCETLIAQNPGNSQGSKQSQTGGKKSETGKGGKGSESNKGGKGSKGSKGSESKPDSIPVKPGKDTATVKGFRVQIVAAPTMAAAKTTVAAAIKAGFHADSVAIVEESKMFKVRVGPYPTRAAANVALSKLKKALGGSPFIVVNK